MKEILIPAVAIFSIFGLPICVMLAAVVATMFEKPRWTLTGRSNIADPAARFSGDLITNP